ncbi:HU family DNA-binding protein [Pseudophaeobacter arcticus]|uniref:HU family DNA-binding protein n=1 Tax=Pseudophaeobacter arcticus TaxID=385492 RepID=UPI003A974EEF
MASSKTGSRKPATRKPTARKALPPKPATKARLAEAAHKALVTPPQQAKEGATALDSLDKPVSPPQALAAGQEPSPVVVASAPVLNEPSLNKRELIDEAVLRSGVKKKDAKPVVEALLAILGETVASGRDLNLKPFGKLLLKRSEVRSNGTVHICRLRQPSEQPQSGQEIAEDADISS